MVVALYLAWYLVKGKIIVTLGTDLRKKTRLVVWEINPTSFWIARVAAAGALLLFTGFLVRTALG